MLLLTIGLVAWVLLAVFVCSLGCAAKAGDRLELERLRGWTGMGVGRAGAPPVAEAPVRRLEEAVHRELLDARRALRQAEARLVRLESGRRASAS